MASAGPIRAEDHSVAFDGIPCSALQPVFWSAKDTDDTIAQVKVFNAQYVAICVHVGAAK